MILGAQTIKDEIKAGNIVITPYDESRVNPNSYNLCLDNKLKVYSDSEIIQRVEVHNGNKIPLISDITLDMAKPNPTKEIIIPEDGIILEPGRLYLGQTVERTSTNKYIPMIEGRSSVGRLGLFVHVTAGFGDIGFDGTWTLELVATQPIKVYPNVPICQIYFHDISDSSIMYHSEKYHGQLEPRESRLYMDFVK